MRKPRLQRPPDEVLDAAVECCRAIATVAELLRRCAGPEPDSPALAGAGYLLLKQTAELHQLLELLHPRLPTAKRSG